VPTTNLTLALLNINLISEHDEREVLGIMRAGLDKEFIPPAIECLERFGAVHVIDENTTVGSTIERDP